MRTNSKSLLFVASVATLTIFGCKKERVAEPAPTPAASSNSLSLNDYFSSRGAQAQNFTIDNGIAQSITGAKGVKLDFTANTFVTQSGAAVTGNVTIQLKEILSKKDMLLSNVLTIAEYYPGSSKEPLVSGGEIYVSATQGGNKLKLAPGKKYTAFLPSASTAPSGMSYFIGKVTPNGILWDPANDSSQISSSTAPNGLFMDCDSLGFGNADHFMSAPSYTTIALNVSGTFDPTQIKAYAWYDNVKTVWPCWGAFNTTTNTCTDDHVALNVPLHLIVISVKDGKLYTGIVATTLTGAYTGSVTLTETSQADFEASLALLP